MTKNTIMLLTALLLLTSLLLSACGGKENGEQNGGTGGNGSTAADTADTHSTDTAGGERVDAGYIGDALIDDFKMRVKEKPDISAEELAGALLTNDVIDFAGATMVMEPGYFMGIDLDEVTGFAEAARFSPMIGSIPFMGYVFRLEGGANAEEFSQLLTEHADLGWNICTFADCKVSAVEGNHVFFLMYESQSEGANA